jgi:hypothetical protein
VTTLEAFLLGILVALTPSLVALAWMLWRMPEESTHEKEE